MQQVALTADGSILTSVANDERFERVRVLLHVLCDLVERELSGLSG